MPRFADVDLQYVEDALHVVVVSAALKARQVRGKPWSVMQQETRRRYAEAMDELLPNFGWMIANYELAGGFDDAEVYVTFGHIGGKVAFSRGLSYGSTIAVSLIVNGDVLAAYVADIHAGTVFGFGPVTPKVKQWYDFGFDLQGNRCEGQPLRVNYSPKLRRQAVLLRGERENYSAAVAAIACSAVRGGLFRRYESVAAGVDFVWTMLELVQGHVGALVLPGDSEWVPWYDGPMMGFAGACDFDYWQVGDDGKLHQLTLRPPLEITKRRHEVVIVPSIHSDCLKAAYEQQQA